MLAAWTEQIHRVIKDKLAAVYIIEIFSYYHWNIGDIALVGLPYTAERASLCLVKRVAIHSIKEVNQVICLLDCFTLNT